jgi:hypothetical protein
MDKKKRCKLAGVARMLFIISSLLGILLFVLGSLLAYIFNNVDIFFWFLPGISICFIYSGFVQFRADRGLISFRELALGIGCLIVSAMFIFRQCGA